MLETVFSATELFLIKKNKKLVLRQTESNVESTSDEELNTSSVRIRSKREQYLLDYTFKPNRDKQVRSSDFSKPDSVSNPINNRT